MAKIMEFNIFDGSKYEYVNSLMEKYRSEKRVIVLSGNPEVLHNAMEYPTISSMINECDIIPDGIGVLIAGKITGQHFKEKVAGIEVMEEILKLSNKNDIKVYMLGAEDWVLDKAASVICTKYNAKIAGKHNGYFDIDSCSELIKDINCSNADVLLIAMGSPRQELFIARYKELINSRIMMGVGGSFDVLAGKINRAPSWMINSGMEWLYRVIKEPYRVKRLGRIPQFLFRVLLYK